MYSVVWGVLLAVVCVASGNLVVVCVVGVVFYNDNYWYALIYNVRWSVFKVEDSRLLVLAFSSLEGVHCL